MNDKMEMNKWNLDYFWNICNYYDLIDYPQFMT